MREYNVSRTELWWIISRKKEMWRLMMLQYLNWYWNRVPNKSSARVFYSQEKALSARQVLIAREKKDLASKKENEWKKSD